MVVSKEFIHIYVLQILVCPTVGHRSLRKQFSQLQQNCHKFHGEIINMATVSSCTI